MAGPRRLQAAVAVGGGVGPGWSRYGLEAAVTGGAAGGVHLEAVGGYPPSCSGP